MPACTYVHMHVRMYVITYLRVYVYVCVCIFMYVYACKLQCMYYVCTYACTPLIDVYLRGYASWK